MTDVDDKGGKESLEGISAVHAEGGGWPGPRELQGALPDSSVYCGMEVRSGASSPSCLMRPTSGTRGCIAASGRVGVLGVAVRNTKDMGESVTTSVGRVDGKRGNAKQR